jgi:putative ABC transport system permease protein
MRFFQVILKNVLHRKSRSLLTTVGVAVAVTAVVALVGIADGFERSFRELYEKRGVDLLVVRAGSSEHLSSSIPQQVGETIRRLPGVHAVSPGLMDVVSFPDANLVSVPLQGWEPDSFLFDGLKILSGRRIEAGDDKGVMLGMVLARNLGKQPGDTLEIAGQPFQVVGVFESFSPLDNGAAVMRLSALQTLMDRPNQVTGFQVVLENTPDKKTAIETARHEIEALRSPKGRPWGVAATPVGDYVRNTSQIRMSHAMAWMTSVIALMIGAIGVLNTMVMSVFERTREIGILRAIGWRKARVVRLILLESVLLSTVGAGIGIGSAVLLTRALTLWPLVNGIIRGDVAPAVMIQGFFIALAVGLIGGAYPAYRGAHLPPTEALRHE